MCIHSNIWYIRRQHMVDTQQDIRLPQSQSCDLAFYPLSAAWDWTTSEHRLVCVMYAKNTRNFNMVSSCFPLIGHRFSHQFICWCWVVFCVFPSKSEPYFDVHQGKSPRNSCITTHDGINMQIIHRGSYEITRLFTQFLLHSTTVASQSWFKGTFAKSPSLVVVNTLVNTLVNTVVNTLVNTLVSFNAFVSSLIPGAGCFWHGTTRDHAGPGTPITVNFPQSDAFAMQSNLHEVYGYLNSSQLINHDAWTNGGLRERRSFLALICVLMCFVDWWITNWSDCCRPKSSILGTYLEDRA